jgi:hypothetical protein
MQSMTSFDVNCLSGFVVSKVFFPDDAERLALDFLEFFRKTKDFPLFFKVLHHLDR